MIIKFFSEHIFFVSALFFSLLWLILFLLINKESKRQMIFVSLVTMVLGPLVEQMHLVDWWQPHFIFNSYIKIEDIIFGFSTGGTISGIYSILKSRIQNNPIISINTNRKILLITISLFSLFGLFYIFHVNSFWSSIISISISVIIVAYQNSKLLLNIFLTGVIVAIIAFGGYLFGLYLNPHFVTETYLFSYLSGILVFGIPIEELLWFFFAGMGVSGFQEIMWNKKNK